MSIEFVRINSIKQARGDPNYYVVEAYIKRYVYSQMFSSGGYEWVKCHVYFQDSTPISQIDMNWYQSVLRPEIEKYMRRNNIGSYSPRIEQVRHLSYEEEWWFRLATHLGEPEEEPPSTAWRLI